MTVGNTTLTALAIEAEALTEKLAATTAEIRKQYGLAPDVTQPATHAVVFARLGSEAADLVEVMLTLMASAERTHKMVERLTE